MRSRPLVLALLALCPAGLAQETAEPVRLGAVFSLSGSQSSLDGPSWNGARLAAKEIGERGGVLRRPLELALVDGRSDAAVLRDATRREVTEGRPVALLGLSDTDAVLAAAAASEGLPFLTSGATSPRLPAQVPDVLFLACFGDNVQAAAAAEFAWDRLEARTAAILSDPGSEYSRLLAGYLGIRFTGLGGRVVATAELGQAAAAVTALAPAPDVVFLSSEPSGAGQVVEALREAGYAGPIVGGDGLDTPLLVEQAGDASNRVWFTTHAFLEPATAAGSVREFLEAYRAEYGEAPADAFAALGYDAVHLLADAIGRAGSTEPAAILRALAATDGFRGVTGTIRYDAGARIPRKTVSIVAIEGGRRSLAAQWDPREVPPP